MKIIPSSYKIEYAEPYEQILSRVVRFARNCYKSEGRMVDTIETNEKFIRSRVTRLDDLNKVRDDLCIDYPGLGKSLSFHDAHEGILEHGIITVRFITNRGISHELVRHRLGSYLQESTRYVLYTDEENPVKGEEFQVIKPAFDEVSKEHFDWYWHIKNSEDTYRKLIGAGVKPEDARGVLTESHKVDILMTANIREWRQVLKLRCSSKAHPQMREIMRPLLTELKQIYSVFFEDIIY